MAYLVMISDENGISTDWILDKEVLIERITPNERGDTYYGDNEPLNFLQAMPDKHNNGEYGIFIVKAEVCIPEPIEVRMAYKIN